MQDALDLLGATVTLVGSVFFLLGGLGVLRMPDSYNRIQTGTKATTLGTALVLIGLGIIHPAWLGKLLILAAFVLLANPISSHALARAAHGIRVPLSEKTVVDKLQEHKDASRAGDAS